MSVHMKRQLLLLLLVGALQATTGSRIESSSTPNEASVAVLDCSGKYPNVYFDVLQREWKVHADASKCFSEERDLLELCRRVYPGLNVVNIMRVNEPVKFTVYGCSNSERNRNCSRLVKKSATPYKCLHGPYKSDELYIPPKCEFQHLYSNDACQTQDHWSLLAAEKCKSSKYSLNSSLLLEWCSQVATFSGIEFVCCPQVNQIETGDLVDEDEDIDDDNSADNEPYDFINYDDYNEDSQDSPAQPLNENSLLSGDEETKQLNNIQKADFNKAESDQLTAMKSEMDNLDTNEFINNFNKVKKIIDSMDIKKEELSDLEAVEGTKEQKEQYEKQKQFIIASIQNSTDNLMKEKSSTHDYLVGTSEKNSVIFETMVNNLNNQYQSRFDRLEMEKDRLLLQEEISYEQQVQGRLNEKKLNTIKELNRVMQEQEKKPAVSLEPLVRALNEFFIAQENDRLHMVTVYKKIKTFFPEQLNERAQSIINHFDSIDRTLNDTVNLFNTKFKLLAKCILPLLKEHLKRYDQVKADSLLVINELKVLQAGSQPLKVEKPKDKPNASSISLVKLNPTRVTKPNQDLNPDNKNFEYFGGDEASPIDEPENDNYYSDENESYNDYQPENSNAKTLIDENINKSINIKRLNGHDSNLTTLLLMIAVCLGVFVSLAIAFVMIKRRRSRSNHIVKHGFLPVDTTNPEDKLVNNMQLNGYENPTYKFFEANTQA